MKIIHTIFLVIFLSNPAHSEVDYELYKYLKNNSDSNKRILLDVAITSQFDMVLSLMGGYKDRRDANYLICLPRKKRVTLEEMYKIIDNEIFLYELNGSKIPNNISISLIFVSGLELAFPCSEGK